MVADTASLVGTVGFELIGGDLGKDVESALQDALEGGVLFANAATPLSIFRSWGVLTWRGVMESRREMLWRPYI